MPTPRSHGGAELGKMPINLPAFKGLNTQIEGALLGPEWATKLDNCVLDSGNRVASRKGWVRRSGALTGPSNDPLVQIYEFITAAGVSLLVATADDNKVWKSSDDGINWSDASGTATISDPNMQFVTFNDELYGWQDGGTVIKYNGTNFADFTASSGTIAQSGVALAAFGRIWAVDSTGTFLQYCGLLDATNWDFATPGSDSGGFEFTNVFQGTDTIKGLAEFNGSLIVFGENNVIVWDDGQGSDLGLDPLNMYVADTLSGIGCVARDSIQNIDGDLWFLSNSGLMSLTRQLSERSNPMQNLSFNVQGELLSRLAVTTNENIRALYSPEERFYLLSMPSAGDLENGVCYVFDTRGRLEDGSARCVGVWSVFVPRAMTRTSSKDIMVYLAYTSPNGFPGGAGEFAAEVAVGIYSGYSDPQEDAASDPVVAYTMEWRSGWSNFDSPYIKLPKRLRSIVYTTGTIPLVFKIWYDFAIQPSGTYTTTVSTVTGDSEWAEAEWSAASGGGYSGAEWSGGLGPSIASIPGVTGTGEYIKLGLSAQVGGSEVAIQEMSVYMKQGRLI